HPLIQDLSFSATRSSFLRGKAPSEPRPTYIPADVFGKVLRSVTASVHELSPADLPNLIAATPDSPLKTRLRTLIAGIEHDAAACNVAIEKWYDDTMDRLNGFYRRKTQVVLLVLGFILAVACNANLFRITGVLWASAA